MRFFALVLVAAYLVIAVGWRSWRQRSRAGSWGVALFRRRTPGAIAFDLGMLTLPLLLVGDAVLAAFYPNALAPVSMPGDHPFLTLGAATLTVGSTLLLVAAQLDLGSSWRIGIEDGACPGLVTEGLYSRVRNPIFSAMLLGFVGFIGLLPNAFTLALATAASCGVMYQVREEEHYLRATYGEAYLDYSRRVGRFVPRVQRPARTA